MNFLVITKKDEGEQKPRYSYLTKRFGQGERYDWATSHRSVFQWGLGDAAQVKEKAAKLQRAFPESIIEVKRMTIRFEVFNENRPNAESKKGFSLNDLDDDGHDDDDDTYKVKGVVENQVEKTSQDQVAEDAD